MNEKDRHDYTVHFVGDWTPSWGERFEQLFENIWAMFAVIFVLAVGGMLTTTYLWGPDMSLMIAVFGGLIVQILFFILERWF